MFINILAIEIIWLDCKEQMCQSVLFQMFKVLPNTIEEIDTCIHQLQAKIDCMMAVDKDVSLSVLFYKLF